MDLKLKLGKFSIKQFGFFYIDTLYKKYYFNFKS